MERNHLVIWDSVSRNLHPQHFDSRLNFKKFVASSVISLDLFLLTLKEMLFCEYYRIKGEAWNGRT